MKTELLVQMDGLSRSDDLVFVLAATNLPWELDQAMLRRLEKRILVPLPCLAARRKLLNCLQARIAADVDLDALAAQLDGYSGSDVVSVAKEAAMHPLRRLMAAMHACAASPSAMSGNTQAATVGPVQAADVTSTLQAVKSTSQLYPNKYAKFAAEFGSRQGPNCA